MKGTRKRFRPWAGLAVLAAAALVLWGGVSLWLQSGWRTITPTLYDQIGDASQLEGFTLSGQVFWRGKYDRLSFALQDGTVQARMQLDAPAREAEQMLKTWYTVGRSCAVVPEDRDAVNAAASFTGKASDGSRHLTAPVERVMRMYTIRLPDDTLVRLAAGEAPTSDYATAYATLAPESVHVSELSSDYDYTWADGSQSFETSWPYDPTGGSCFTLGAGYGLCWAKDYLGRAPGLYRADGLTADEIAALPRDGVLYDREVLCASTEFGTLEPFYCPEDADQALAGVAMADGSTLLVYRTTEGMICADLVNAAGSCTDHRELGEAKGWLDISDATLLPRTTDSEAFLRITADPDCLVLVRAENGRFTLARLLEDKDLVLPDTVVLNEAGDKMLLARNQTVYRMNNTPVAVPSENGIALRVYELDTGHLTYLGRLSTGGERDWGQLYTMRNLHNDRYITFDTLQKDGGLLP